MVGQVVYGRRGETFDGDTDEIGCKACSRRVQRRAYGVDEDVKGGKMAEDRGYDGEQTSARMEEEGQKLDGN